jgi:hypothetical protein
LRIGAPSRRLLFAFIALATFNFSWVLQPAGALAERDLVTNFDSFIYLSQDSSLRISETIDIYFAKKERQNIARFIPLSAEVGPQKYRIYIKLNSVTCDGRPIPYRETFDEDKLKIQFGDDAREVGGQHQFVISYIARGAVRPSEKGPQVYWNATGNEWTMPVERATVALCPPKGTALYDFTGQSSAGPNQSPQAKSPTFSEKAIVFKASNLAPGRALTITVQMPNDAVRIPLTTVEFSWMIEQLYQVVLSILSEIWGWLLLAFVIALAAVIRFWSRRTPPEIIRPKSNVTSYRTQ